MLDVQIKLSLLFAILLMTFIVPTISTLFFIRSSSIVDITLSERKSRNYPLLFTFLTYLITAYFCFNNLNQDLTFTYIMVFNSLVVFVVLITNLWWKISAHAAGIGGVVAYFLLFLSFDKNLEYLPYLISLIIISGLIISSRIALNAHNAMQTYLGFVLGFITTLFIKIFI